MGDLLRVAARSCSRVEPEQLVQRGKRDRVVIFIIIGTSRGQQTIDSRLACRLRLGIFCAGKTLLLLLGSFDGIEGMPEFPRRQTTLQNVVDFR